MKCHICNATLNPNEIKENKDHKDFDPCGKCLQIIEEVFEPLDEEEIRNQLDTELELEYDEEPEESS